MVYFSDLSMPTPPPIQRRLTLAAQTQKSVCVPVPETDEDIEPGAMDTTQEHDSNLNMDTTNKTLRFANMSPDGAAEDVSMEPEDILSCPSVRRSIRDRSPTPERYNMVFSLILELIFVKDYHPMMQYHEMCIFSPDYCTK